MTGNVIRIIDEYTLIIDMGETDLGVGDKVQVYSVGEKILDLKGNVLDNFVHVKDTLEVIQVEELYSICKKPRIRKTNLTLSPLLEVESYTRVPLNVDKSEINPPDTYDEKIHVGDLVKLID